MTTQAETETIDWKMLSSDSSEEAYELLMQHPDRICWRELCNNENPKIVELLFKNMDKLSLITLQQSTNQVAMKLYKQLVALYTSTNFKSFMQGIPIDNWIEPVSTFEDSDLRDLYDLRDIDAIDFDMLSVTNSEIAISILKNNPKRINWHVLCYNESMEVYDLLINNIDKINIKILSINKNERLRDLSETLRLLYISTNIKLFAREFANTEFEY